MKKIIALVLALVMTLSLLPMTVWATETATSTDVPQQLYAGFIENDNTVWNTSVNCPSGDQRGFYLGIKNGDTYTTITSNMIGADQNMYSLSDSGNIGKVTSPDSYNFCGLRPNDVAPAQGYIQLTHNGSGTVYRLPVEISYPPLFMYGQGQNGPGYFNGTGFGVGGVQEFPLYIQVRNSETAQWEYVPITQTDGYVLGCSDEELNIALTWSTEEGKENVAIIDTRNVSLSEEKTVYFTAAKDGHTYGLQVFLHPEENQGGNQNHVGYPTFGNVQLFVSTSDQGVPMLQKMNINAGTTQSFYLWYGTNDGFQMITKDDNPVVAVTDSDIGAFAIDEDDKLTWNAANVSANRQAVLSVTVGNITYQAFIYTTGSAKDRVPDPEREDMDIDLSNASFKYKGTDYYLVPVYASGSGVTRQVGNTFSIEKTGTKFWSYTAGLATTKNGTDFTIVHDPEILAMLENVEYSLTPLDREWIRTNGDSMPLCMMGEDSFEVWGQTAQYTTLKTYNESSDPIGFVFEFSSAGPYKLTVSATVDGKSISSSVCTTAFYKGIHVISNLSTVEQINAALAEYKEQNPNADAINDQIVVNLPNGELHGVIEVPGGLPDVKFNGSEQRGTTLYGGICAENVITSVENIRFIGVGQGVKTLSDGVTPNYGIWGKALGDFNSCTFSDYDCAVVSSYGVRFGGTNCIFYNNRVALWMNIDPISRQGGNLQMRRMVFAHNDVALQLDRFTSTLDLGIYVTEQNIFYKNGKDAELANSKRSFFMPGNVYDENNGVQRNFRGNVYGDPYYLLSDIGRQELDESAITVLPLGAYNERWIESSGGKFIKVFPANWKVPLIYANAEDYVIPANELKKEGVMTIDVVDNAADGTNDVIGTIKLKNG